MRVVVIQSRENQEVLQAERESYREAVAGAAAIEFISALDESQPWDAPDQILSGYSAVFLGGSADFDLHGGRKEEDRARVIAREILVRLRPLVTHVMQNNFPVFAICFGHQLIGEMYGGKISSDLAQKKFGSYEVNLTYAGKKDPLFRQLPESMYAQYGHKDSVTTKPLGATVLASSNQCLYSALRYTPVAYTVQFHPELRAEDMMDSLDKAPDYLPEGRAGESLIQDSTDVSRLIPLFLEMIRK